MALFSGRRSTANHLPSNEMELWDFFRETNARYLVVGPPAAEEERREYLLGFVTRNRDRFWLEFSNADFQVFSIH